MYVPVEHSSRNPVGLGAARIGNWILHDLPRGFVDLFRNHRKAAALTALALASFFALAIFAMTSETTLLRLDQTMQGFILESRTAWLDRAMVWLTFLGTRYVIGAASVGLLAWSLIRRRHRTFVMLIVAAVLLNPVFEIGFKELVDRVRPAVSQLLPGNGPSFPSGHVLAAVGFYGLIPFLTWEVTKNAWARFASVIGSLAIISVVTISRPYLDVHWTTDAIAGVLLGTVLVAATYQVFLRLSAPRRLPIVRK
ncbi:MAG: phosphatase PAP2 family protein [Acidimicrobiia bacterium]|nr:phosphatase PAP2 family protein [Acidimicrobiia bacterium]